LNIEF